MDRPFDVTIFSDLRLPGGTCASIAEEVRAQAAAGLSTALLHADSSLVAKPRGFNPKVAATVADGDAQVVVGRPVATRLLVVRHPTVLATVPPEQLPQVEAERVVVVANQAPGTPDGQVTHYDPQAVDAKVRAWLGDDVEVMWTPIGRLVRDNLQLIAPELVLTDQDWVNIIDVDAWAVDRSGGVVGRPVLGRHSRDHQAKWPADPATLRAAYPDADDVEVAVLGGAVHAERTLDGLPANWTVHEFGDIEPARFLAEVDFLVYFHHEDWVEAFGRTILEAMASGAVCLLPHHFEPMFGDAAVYVTADQVLATVRELTADTDRYVALAEHGQRVARQRFGHEAHRARLARLLDREVVAPERRRPQRPRVLFVSSNGAGVGHLMRLMSMARRAEATDALFLTLSQALRVVDDLDHYVEYCPSRQYLGGRSVPWHEMFHDRLCRMIDEHGVEAVVFDGTMPYWGLFDLADSHPEVALVWSRRAMWRAGVTNPTIEESHRFDLIVEPGEFAADLDKGVTRARRAEATRVAPITFLDPDEQLDRAAARAELGLDPDRPAAIVQLGAGNINDTTSLLEAVVSVLTRDPDMQVRVTRSAIAEKVTELPGDVETISVYPLARFYAAFDVAVAASGYNTFHELVATPVPTLFLPNMETSTDDQLGRARFAEQVGVGTCLEDVTAAGLERALTPLLDPQVRQRMRERAQVRATGNGAGDAMAAIERLVAARRGGSAAADPAAAEAATVAGSGVVPEPPLPHAPAASMTARAAAADEAATGAASGDADRSADGGRSPAATTPSEPSAEPSGSTDGDGTSPEREPAGSLAATRNAEPETPATPAAPAGPRPLKVRARKALAKAARDERLRTVGVPVFRALPEDMRRRLRRQVNREERRRLARAAEVRPTGNQLGAPMTVPAGTVLPERERDELLRVAVVLPDDASDELVRAVTDRVAGLQLAWRTFAPLFVTSSTDAGAFRRYGFAFEHLPSATTWARIADPADRRRHVQERLAEVVYRYDVPYVFDGADPDALAVRLQAVIGTPRVTV